MRIVVCAYVGESQLPASYCFGMCEVVRLCNSLIEPFCRVVIFAWSIVGLSVKFLSTERNGHLLLGG